MRYFSQGRTCLDAGAYMVNYAGCVVCQKVQPLVTANREEVDVEDMDEITFERM